MRTLASVHCLRFPSILLSITSDNHAGNNHADNMQTCLVVAILQRLGPAKPHGSQNQDLSS